MSELQQKRQICRAFNELTTKRTEGHLTMALMLRSMNGLQCALDFIAKMKEYEAEESEAHND